MQTDGNSGGFVVQHEHNLGGNVDDVKFIGLYRTWQDAEAAIERARLQPGFREHPDGFSIDFYAFGEDHWREGFVTV